MRLVGKTFAVGPGGRPVRRWPATTTWEMTNLEGHHQLLKHTNYGISLQCEAPKIAKLVYNSNNYGLWMFMVLITI